MCGVKGVEGKKTKKNFDAKKINKNNECNHFSNDPTLKKM